MSVVTVLLLAAAAGCSSSSSSSSSGATGDPGNGSGSGSSSTVTSGGSQAGGSQTGGSNGSQTGDSLSADGSGASGENGGGASGKNGDRGGASSPPAGVLLGADSLPSAAADHCRTKNLTAVARTTGQGRASVVITNKADGSCTVRGFPSLLFISEAGRTELPVDWDGSAADAAKFTLAPGDSASATLTFTGLDECDAMTGLDITPPGESRPLTPAFTTTGKKKAVRICDTGVRVQAFAPAR
jgi:hypothetical protein